MNRKSRQLMYTHLSQIDLPYTAARHHGMKLGKPVGSKRNRAGPHSVLKTPVPSPIVMSAFIGGATPCPMIGVDAVELRGPECGVAIEFLKEGPGLAPPSVRLWGSRPGETGTDAGWGEGRGQAKNWRWAGPATPIQVPSNVDVPSINFCPVEPLSFSLTSTSPRVQPVDTGEDGELGSFENTYLSAPTFSLPAPPPLSVP